MPDDLWYLPGGKTLRVVAQPHPFGGLTFLYEDVTEKLALESSYNTLIKVQSATLDTLSEAVAVFGPDARLKLHNRGLSPACGNCRRPILRANRMCRRLAEACIARFGDAAIWQKLAVSICLGRRTQPQLGAVRTCRQDRARARLSRRCPTERRSSPLPT